MLWCIKCFRRTIHKLILKIKQKGLDYEYESILKCVRCNRKRVIKADKISLSTEASLGDY